MQRVTEERIPFLFGIGNKQTTLKIKYFFYTNTKEYKKPNDQLSASKEIQSEINRMLH